jgi:hypothetical protein
VQLQLGGNSSATRVIGNTFSNKDSTDVVCLQNNTAQALAEGNYFSACNIAAKSLPPNGNFTFQGNRVFAGSGTKVYLSGAGNAVDGNYLAWNTASGKCVVSYGDARSGQLVVNDTGNQATAHGRVSNNIIHSDVSGAIGVCFPDVGKRCVGGAAANQYKACTSSSDCGGSTCSAVANADFDVSNNTIIGNITTGIDFSALTTGNTTLSGGKVSGNYIGTNVTNCLALPASGTVLSELPYIGNTCLGTNAFTNYTENFLSLEANTPPSSNKQFDVDTTCDNTTVATGSDVTVANLADYDNTGRNTLLVGCATLTAQSGGTRAFTLKIKLEGSAVYTGDTVTAPASGNVTLCGQYLDTTSATARTAILTITAGSGTTNSAGGCTFSRHRS